MPLRQLLVSQRQLLVPLLLLEPLLQLAPPSLEQLQLLELELVLPLRLF